MSAERPSSRSGPPGAALTSALVLRELSLTFPGNPPVAALRALSARIPPGVTWLRGPSGAGKSTLLRVIATLLRPDEGWVEYPWGVRLPAGGSREELLEAEVRLRLGYVPQESRLDLGLRARDALAYLAASRGLARARQHAEALLSRWGLEQNAGLPLSRLSTGERRRWLLAQSRLGDPALWILDEPLLALDAEGRLLLFEELAGYRRDASSGRFALVSGHDLELGEVADHVLALEAGRLAEMDGR